MTKIIIRHLTGARANQFDEFPLSAAQELIVGRDLAANVRVDPERDDLVSRQHLKIACPTEEPEAIQLIDLQSRNGTFLNNQRINGAVHLSHNDVVQLGAGGPEFRFELDPPPASAGPRPTREATFEQGFGPRPTRDAWSPTATVSLEGAAAPSRPVGRATVERMLGEQFSKVKSESNKAVWIGVIGLLAILAIGLGGWFYLRQTRNEQIADLESSLAAQQRQAVELRKKSDQQSVKELEKIDQDIQKQMAELQALKAKEEARKAAEDRRAAAEAKRAMAAIPAPQSPAVANPVAAAATAAGVDPNSSYNSLIDQATDRFQHGKTKEALDVVKVAIAKDSNRWEGYEFAGQLAERLGDYTTANGMFEDALKWAPAENRQDIQFKLNALKEKLAAR